MLDQLAWTMQRAGPPTVTATLVAQGETIFAATQAGTPGQYGLTRFGHFNGSVLRNGMPIGNVVSAQVSYANNLDRIETIRNGGMIDGADPSVAALTGSLEARFVDLVLRRPMTAAPVRWSSAMRCPPATASRSPLIGTPCPLEDLPCVMRDFCFRCPVASAWALQIVASINTYSRSGSLANSLNRRSHTPEIVQRRTLQCTVRQFPSSGRRSQSKAKPPAPATAPHPRRADCRPPPALLAPNQMRNPHPLRVEQSPSAQDHLPFMILNQSSGRVGIR